ncbi:ATP-grasp domain-containing protein [Propioniciclava coleopterorum]|uniref:ATP-grasp domain-containing protein n=1 Tax=Propioniciclava coleopterorum TaxID=2714937 RepID=A0A6G7Y6U2_9ACTN|nr:ATP-grasp domain-containing protein [Propioniciclava coleopterorum]QIK72503.1 ATP-grasp domain-containing protein [Propioniciclava coleopterorum]
MLLLVPADPLRGARPDPHWAREYEAALALGLDVALLDHDAAERGDAAAAVHRVPASADVVYRGWMLTAGQYAGVAGALAGRGARLRTSPDAFRAAHELPGWAPTFEGLTPDTAVADGFDRPAFEAALDRLGPGAAVLRDHVKSAKQDWETACFVPEASDRERAWRVAQNLIRIRGDHAVGGLVARRFEELTGPELRSWWVDGALVCIGAHPDEPDADTPGGKGVAACDESPRDPALVAFLEAIGVRVRGLGLPFVTVDLARGADRWWVIELGDGQVSDLRRDADPRVLLRALAE